jgi:hypothetical protein
MSTSHLMFGSQIVPIVQAGNPTYNPPLRGLLVCAIGDVEVIVGGVTALIPIDTAPFIIPFYINGINGTNTTVADADLWGIR